MLSINELINTANVLEPTHPVARRMLKDALKGDWGAGVHRQKQEALLRLHEAQKKIAEAIALLEASGERPLSNHNTQKTPIWQKAAPGELRPAAAMLVCQYYGYRNLFQQNGLWYAFAANSSTPTRLGQHMWLELCKTESTEWLEAKIQQIESDHEALLRSADREVIRC
jgi:hypothetical protein